MSDVGPSRSWLASSLRVAQEKSQRLPEAIRTGSFSASPNGRDEKRTASEPKR